MIVQPYNVESATPCETTARRRDGAYICNLHHVIGTVIKRTPFKMGPLNPLTESIGDIAGELRDRLPYEYRVLQGRTVQLDSFIGLSIVRVCTRAGHGGRQPEIPDTPRTERVASFAFATEPVDIIAIDLHKLAHQRGISAHGIGSAKRGGVAGATNIDPLVHLPLALSELNPALQVSAAVAAFPSTGKARDPFVALHQPPALDESSDYTIGETPKYIEQIIPRSALPS